MNEQHPTAATRRNGDPAAQLVATSKVPAADQTLRILSLLATSRGPMAATMIASQLDIPRSTVYHLLGTLQEHGYVLHLPEERRYGLGIAAVALSSAYERQEPLTRIGRPLLAALVDRVGVSGHLAVPHGRDVLYVIEERAAGSPPLVTDVDVRLPMHLTASGRAILSMMSKAQVRALYPSSDAFVSRSGSPGQIDRYSRLRSVLDDTLNRGYALERGDITDGLASVGLPVLDHRGWPVAAIAVTFPEQRLTEAQVTALAADVRTTAEALSARIHGRRVAS
ncbi:IclR family transcriptional regulator [Leucobacter sp. cx-328]|uniref:IclR family transcriptional regulator n=1 Tax=unclassified Leucobacter TaxID=2621730 RepID=UPI00165D6D35|nr:MULTISPECIES: IclR family transcriptional regulator [unclassified Leucobacter]MBC9943336.1 IclR family transcriptional regulator [Leucobacter sp. cx-328]